MGGSFGPEDREFGVERGNSIEMPGGRVGIAPGGRDSCRSFAWISVDAFLGEDMAITVQEPCMGFVGVFSESTAGSGGDDGSTVFSIIPGGCGEGDGGTGGSMLEDVIGCSRSGLESNAPASRLIRSSGVFGFEDDTATTGSDEDLVNGGHFGFDKGGSGEALESEPCLVSAQRSTVPGQYTTSIQIKVDAD